jgi:hypothetical protein
MDGQLHATEHRGYRELYSFARQLAEHWPALASRFEPDGPVAALRQGATAARTLLQELDPLTASYGLYGKPAAQGVGVFIARSRAGVRDRLLERDRALRLSVLELQYLTMLLGYLGAVARGRRDHRLADFCGRWERKLRRVESAARKAAVELGADADAAVQPLDPSPVGRAAQSLGYAAGAVGEWVDRRAANRRG